MRESMKIKLHDRQFRNSRNVELTAHSPYLAPSEYHLFRATKQYPSGHGSKDDREVETCERMNGNTGRGMIRTRSRKANPAIRVTV